MESSGLSKANTINLKAVEFRESDQALLAYDAGQCDALTADATYLAAARTALQDPAAHVILPERISKEPLALIVREGDNAWADVVRWTHFVMLTAEELGVTASNVERLQSSSADPQVQLLLGVTVDTGRGFGLPREWASNVIRHVGNYAEVFDRNLGSDSPLNMERGPNALWRDGGLQFAPPIR